MKKETLEDFTKEVLQDDFFTNIAEYGKAERLIEIGTKWQQEQDKNKYSEEEVLEILVKAIKDVKVKQLTFFDGGSEYPIYSNLIKWFKQFKKKWKK